MKERKKIIFAGVTCILMVVSIILSFFDQDFRGCAACFGISLFMAIQHRTALIPKKRVSLIINDFKRPFQSFGKLKEYHTWTWILSVFFFVLGALGTLIFIFH